MASRVSSEESKLAQDHKRDVDHRRKYSFGVVELGTKIVPEKHTKQRPHWRNPQVTEREHRHAAARSKSVGKHPEHFDTEFATSDSSADESIREASAAPEPDADIAYSYDAKRGPSQGSEILHMAINKAVERYENKATEKLLKDEYEVVTHEADAHNEGYAADDDDFLLI